MTAQPRWPARMPDKNPGREGGPIAFQHTADGIVAIGADGFPVIDDETGLNSTTESTALERYSVIDVEPESVADSEIEARPSGE